MLSNPPNTFLYFNTLETHSEWSQKAAIFVSKQTNKCSLKNNFNPLYIVQKEVALVCSLYNLMNGDAKVVHSTSLQRRIVLWGLLRTAVVIKGILSGRLSFTKLIQFMASLHLFIIMSS